MNRTPVIVLSVAVLGVGLAAGYWLGHRTPATASAPAGDKQVLYWYDPMKPDQHFDHPGKSPFMDMQLVPKYPEGGATSEGSVRIDPTMVQNLGMRTATVEMGTLAGGLHVPATIGWDLRQATAISARADGVIDKLYVRAPFEHVTAGQPLASLIAPEWNSAAQEYLALGAARSWMDARCNPRRMTV